MYTGFVNSIPNYSFGKRSNQTLLACPDVKCFGIKTVKQINIQAKTYPVTTSFT